MEAKKILAPAQRDIYFQQLLYPDAAFCNIGARVQITGNLNIECFKQAYVQVINSHDAYRSYLRADGNVVELIVTDEIRPLEFIDLSNLSQQKIESFIDTEFKKAFNIERDKFLYRFILIKASAHLHYVLTVCHHILTDGWGTSLVFQRFITNYNEALNNKTPLYNCHYSYQDYCIENESYLVSKEFTLDQEYWNAKLNNLPETFLPAVDPNQKVPKSLRKELVIKRHTYNLMLQLALEHKSTPFHVFLAIFYIYFGKTYQKETISIGVPILNRSNAKYKKTVGLFMNIIPLIITVKEDDSFIELLEKIKNQLRQDYRHQQFPTSEITRLVGAQHKEKLLNVTLSYENGDYSEVFQDTSTIVVPLSHGAGLRALSIYIREFDKFKDVEIHFDYNINYFNQETIEKLTSHVEKLLFEILNNVNKRIMDFEYLNSSALTAGKL